MLCVPARPCYPSFMISLSPLKPSACSALARLFLALLATVFSIATDAAEIPQSATLDEVLAIAARPNLSNKEKKFYDERMG